VNCDTGELMRAINIVVGMKQIVEEVKHSKELPVDGVVTSIPDGFKQVPDDLAAEAEKELDGKDRVIVDMTKNTSLVQWARSQRRVKNKKRSNLKSMQTASKKRNRK